MTEVAVLQARLTLLKNEYDRGMEDAWRSAKRFQGAAIAPQVDDKALHELNKLYDKKIAHHKQVGQFVAANPITPDYDGRNLVAGINQLREYKTELAAVKSQMGILGGNLITDVNQKVTVDFSRFDYRMGYEIRQLGKDFAKDLRKVVDAVHGLKPSLLSRIVNFATAPIRGVGQGVVEGLGFSAAASMYKGLDNDVKKALERLGDQIFQYASKKGVAIGEAVSKNMGYAEGLKDVKKDLIDIGRRLDDLTDPAKFEIGAIAFEKSIVAGLERLNKGDLSGFQANIRKAFDPTIEVLKEFSLRLGGVGLRIGAQPFRVMQKARLSDQAEAAKAMSSQFNVKSDQADRASSIAIVTGGIDFSPGGTNTDFAASAIKELFPQAYISKSYNEEANKLPQNFISDLLKAFQGDDYKPMPIERLLQNAIMDQGFADSVKMASKAYAYKQQYPDKPVNLFGTSGGSYIVENAIAILEKMGVKDVKGVGLTSPMMGLTPNSNPEQFRTFVGELDPIFLSSFGGRFQSNPNNPAIKRTFNNLPVPPLPYLMTPDFRRTKVIENAGMGHHLLPFISNQDTQAGISNFLGIAPAPYTEGDTGKKAMNFLLRKQQESGTLYRTVASMVGDSSVIKDVASGDPQKYAFIDRTKPEWRRDNDLAGAIKEIESKAKHTTGEVKKYAEGYLEFLRKLLSQLTRFYETAGKSGISDDLIQEFASFYPENQDALNQTLGRSVKRSGLQLPEPKRIAGNFQTIIPFGQVGNIPPKNPVGGNPYPTGYAQQLSLNIAGVQPSQKQPIYGDFPPVPNPWDDTPAQEDITVNTDDLERTMERIWGSGFDTLIGSADKRNVLLKQILDAILAQKNGGGENDDGGQPLGNIPPGRGGGDGDTELVVLGDNPPGSPSAGANTLGQAGEYVNTNQVIAPVPDFWKDEPTPAVEGKATPQLTTTWVVGKALADLDDIDRKLGKNAANMERQWMDVFKEPATLQRWLKNVDTQMLNAKQAILPPASTEDYAVALKESAIANASVKGSQEYWRPQHEQLPAVMSKGGKEIKGFDAISSRVGNSTQVLNKVMAAIEKDLKNTISPDMLRFMHSMAVSLGAEIPVGLGIGIGDFANQPKAKQKELALQMITIFKDVMGIKSPSKVFQLIGQQIVAGLVDGLTGFDGTLAEKKALLETYVKSFLDLVDGFDVANKSTGAQAKSLVYKKDVTADELLPYIPKLSVTKQRDGIAAYNRQTGLINVTPEVLGKKTDTHLVEAFAHELTHAFQFKNTKSNPDLLFFESNLRKDSAKGLQQTGYSNYISRRVPGSVDPAVNTAVEFAHVAKQLKLPDAPKDVDVFEKNYRNHLTKLETEAYANGEMTFSGYKGRGGFLADQNTAAIGKDIVKGLALGIANGALSVFDAIGDIGDGLIGRIKKILGIASPSKVFMQIGKDTVQGQVEGVKSAAPALLREYVKLGNAVALVYEATMAGVVTDVKLTKADSGEWDDRLKLGSDKSPLAGVMRPELTTLTGAMSDVRYSDTALQKVFAIKAKKIVESYLKFDPRIAVNPEIAAMMAELEGKVSNYIEELAALTHDEFLSYTLTPAGGVEDVRLKRVENLSEEDDFRINTDLGYLKKLQLVSPGLQREKLIQDYAKTRTDYAPDKSLLAVKEQFAEIETSAQRIDEDIAGWGKHGQTAISKVQDGIKKEHRQIQKDHGRDRLKEIRDRSASIYLETFLGASSPDNIVNNAVNLAKNPISDVIGYAKNVSPTMSDSAQKELDDLRREYNEIAYNNSIFGKGALLETSRYSFDEKQKQVDIGYTKQAGIDPAEMKRYQQNRQMAAAAVIKHQMSGMGMFEKAKVMSKIPVDLIPVITGKTKNAVFAETLQRLEHEAYVAGTFIGIGLGNGIEAESNQAPAAIAKVGKSTITTMMNVLEEKSPSRVFFRIGQFVIQGFNNGLTASQIAPNLRPQITKIIQDIQGELQQELERPKRANESQRSFDKKRNATSQALRDVTAMGQDLNNFDLPDISKFIGGLKALFDGVDTTIGEQMVLMGDAFERLYSGNLSGQNPNKLRNQVTSQMVDRLGSQGRFISAVVPPLPPVRPTNPAGQFVGMGSNRFGTIPNLQGISAFVRQAEQIGNSITNSGNSLADAINSVANNISAIPDPWDTVADFSAVPDPWDTTAGTFGGTTALPTTGLLTTIPFTGGGGTTGIGDGNTVVGSGGTPTGSAPLSGINYFNNQPLRRAPSIGNASPAVADPPDNRRIMEKVVDWARNRVREIPGENFESFFRTINRGLDAIESGSEEAGIGVRGLGQILGDLGRANPTMGKVVSTLKDIGVGVLFALGIAQVDQLLVDFGRASLDAAIKVERFKVALSYNTSGGLAGLQRIRDMSSEIGANFLTTAENYAKLTVASSGTNIAPQVENITTGFTKALVAQGANPEQQGRAFLAIQQMIGKNQIMAEELRQQLAEVMPQATSALARAKGMTPQQLVREMKTTALLPEEDLLPLAKQLEIESTIPLTTFRAGPLPKLANIENKTQQIQSTVGEALLKTPFALDAVSKGMDVLAASIGFVSTAAIAFALGIGVKAVAGLLAFGSGTRIVTLLVKAMGLEFITNNVLLGAWNNTIGSTFSGLRVGAQGAGAALLGVGSALINIGVAMAPLVAVTTAIQLVMKVWKSYNTELKQVGEQAQKTAQQLAALADSKKKGKENKQLQDNLNNPGLQSGAGGLFDFFASFYNPLANPIDKYRRFDTSRPFFGLTDTTDELGVKKTIFERQEQLTNRGEGNQFVQSSKTALEATKSALNPETLQDLSGQLMQNQLESMRIQAEQQQVATKDPTGIAYEDLQKRSAILSEKRMQIMEGFGLFPGSLEEIIKGLEQYAEELRKDKAMPEAKRNAELATVAQQIGSMRGVLAQINDSAAGINANTRAIDASMKNINAMGQDARANNEMISSQTRVQVGKDFLAGNINSLDYGLIKQDIAVTKARNDENIALEEMNQTKANFGTMDEFQKQAEIVFKRTDMQVDLKKYGGDVYKALLSQSPEKLEQIIQETPGLTGAFVKNAKLYIESTKRFLASQETVIQAEEERLRAVEEAISRIRTSQRNIKAANTSSRITGQFNAGVIGEPELAFREAQNKKAQAQDALAQALDEQRTRKGGDPVQLQEAVNAANQALVEAERQVITSQRSLQSGVRSQKIAIEDYNQSVFDNQLQFARQVRDTQWETEDSYRNMIRQTRDLQESWRDLVFGLDTKILEAQLELKNSKDALAKVQRRITVEQVSPFSENYGRKAATIVADYLDALDGNESEARNLEKEQRAVGEEYVTTLRSIRGEVEKQLDAEVERNRTLIRLNERYMDLVITVDKAVRDMERRAKEIATAIERDFPGFKGMVDSFTRPDTSLAGANTQYSGGAIFKAPAIEVRGGVAQVVNQGQYQQGNSQNWTYTNDPIDSVPGDFNRQPAPSSRNPGDIGILQEAMINNQAGRSLTDPVYQQELLGNAINSLETAINGLNNQPVQQPVPQVQSRAIDLPRGYESVEGLANKNLINNKYFNLDTPADYGAMGLAIATAATEAFGYGTQRTDWFTRMGGSGNNMKGFGQANQSYHAKATATPDSYMNWIGQIFHGDRKLPNSKGQADFAQLLASQVQSGQINNGADLIRFTKDRGNAGLAGTSSGFNWQGLADGWGRNPGLADWIVNWLKQNLQSILGDGNLSAKLNFGINPGEIEGVRTAQAVPKVLTDYGGTTEPIDISVQPKSVPITTIREGAIKARELSPDNWFWKLIDGGQWLIDKGLGRENNPNQLEAWKDRQTEQTGIPHKPIKLESDQQFWSVPPSRTDNSGKIRDNTVTPDTSRRTTLVDPNASYSIPDSTINSIYGANRPGQVITGQMGQVADPAPITRTNPGEAIAKAEINYQERIQALELKRAQLVAQRQLEEIKFYNAAIGLLFEMESAQIALGREDAAGRFRFAEMQMDAKGYVTDMEAVAKVGYEVTKSFIDIRNSAQDRDRQLQKDLGLEQVKMAEMLDQINSGKTEGGKQLSAAEIAQLREFVAEIENNVKGLQGQREQLQVNADAMLSLEAATKRSRMEMEALNKTLAGQQAFADRQANYFQTRYDVGAQNSLGFGTIINKAPIVKAQMDAITERSKLRELEKQNILKPEDFAALVRMQDEMNQLNLDRAFVQAIPGLEAFSSELKNVILESGNLGEAVKKMGNVVLGIITDQMVIKPLQNFIAKTVGPLLGFNDESLKPVTTLLGSGFAAERTDKSANNIVPFSLAGVTGEVGGDVLSPYSQASDAILGLADSAVNSTSILGETLNVAGVTQQTATANFTNSLAIATQAVYAFAGALNTSGGSGLFSSAVSGGGSGLLGGLFSAANAFIPSSGYTGATVSLPNFAEGGAIADAMKRERIQSGGKQPILAVINTDEYVIPAKEAAEYTNWKGIKANDVKVKNFATGGFGDGRKLTVNTTTSTSGGSTNNFYNNTTIKVQNPNDIGMSAKQIERQRKLNAERNML